MTQHFTAADQVALSPFGWAPLDQEWEVDRLPPVDVRGLTDPAYQNGRGGPLFARPHARAALEAAGALGVELVTRADVLWLHEIGCQIEPVTRAETQELEASRWHDDRVFAALDAVEWNGLVPVSGAGKHIVSGAPPGRCYLCGWWTRELSRFTPPAGQRGHRSGPGWVQEGADAGAGPHNDLHFDYGTTARFKRRRRRGSLVGLFLELGDVVVGSAELLASRVWASARTYGGGTSGADAIVGTARALLASRLAEETGRNDGAKIGALFVGCTRRQGGLEVATGWKDADATGPGWDWCAAFASSCAIVGAAEGFTKRISVRELYEDAVRRGRWHPAGSGYQAKPGDLWLQARGDADPTKGGQGHVAVVESVSAAGVVVTIGGNEENAVRRRTRSESAPEFRGYYETA